MDKQNIFNKPRRLCFVNAGWNDCYSFWFAYSSFACKCFLWLIQLPASSQDMPVSLIDDSELLIGMGLFICLSVWTVMDWWPIQVVNHLSPICQLYGTLRPHYSLENSGLTWMMHWMGDLMEIWTCEYAEKQQYFRYNEFEPTKCVACFLYKQAQIYRN